MGKVNRLTASAVVTSVALVFAAQVSHAAQPSPSLSTVLIAPSGTYTESTNPREDGPVSATDYAGADAQTMAQLRRDNFVGGYARTWVAHDQKHFVVEQVIAFGGHRDATSWLSTFKGMSGSQYLVRPINADGVDSYFGGHYADPARPLYVDVGAFLKGNDFFTVSALSQLDDLGNTATSQAQRQFNAAPAYSISPNQWPENASRAFNLSAWELPLAIGGGVVLVFLMIAALAVVMVLTRRPAQPAAAQGPLMSQDGRYWWDGQTWRDTGIEVPPDALKSADGYYWWDSRSWRQVPPPS